MSAWSTRVFGDDAAQDWLFALVSRDDIDLISATISVALDPAKQPRGFLTSPDSSRALAAAEVIAAARGNPSDDLPEFAEEWLNERKLTIDDVLVSNAIRAVRQVASDSELRDLWEDEVDSFDEWQQVLDGLLHRLSR